MIYNEIFKTRKNCSICCICLNKVVVILKSSYNGIKEIGFDDFKIVEKVSAISSITYNLKQIKRGDSEKFTLTEEKNHMFTLELASRGKEKVLSAIAQLQKLDMVLVAEPSYIYEVESCWTPSDSEYRIQWNLNGRYGIQAEQAWEITRGSTDIKVGIMEGGIDMEHEDLQGRVFLGNFDTSIKSNLAHGTHVAGIIGAKKNDFGIAGVADCSMYLLELKSAEFANSLIYASQNNIKIINASFHYPKNSDGTGYASYNSAHYTALSNYNGLFVVAAGNDRKDNDNEANKHYPACYDLPNIISVGAIKGNGAKETMSNFGSKTVDIFAPGEAVYSTLPNNSYGNDTGTSMAAPHVTGVAALIYSLYPNINPKLVKEIIMNNVDKDDALSDKCVSGGRLNAYNAVKNIHTEHLYNNNYVYINEQFHKSICVCGKSTLSRHWAYAGTSGRYVTCEVCGISIDTDKYPILITIGGANSASVTYSNTSLISSKAQLVSYLDFAQAETVLTNEQIGEITEYYDEKFFAEYSIMFGDIESDEVLYWLLKNATGWPAD